MKIKQLLLVFLGHISLMSLGLGQDIASGYLFKRTDGRYLVPAMILPNGDTMIYMELREFEVKAPKIFANAEDYKRWDRYRRLAPTIIPYAVNAVKIYRQIEVATRDMANKDRNKYIKALETDMDNQLRKNLTNLSKTQGFLLIEMIEKELHMPFYDLVKDVKGSFSAFYWNEFAKLYSYQLKVGYERGVDPILDSILNQYDLSYYLY